MQVQVTYSREYCTAVTIRALQPAQCIRLNWVEIRSASTFFFWKTDMPCSGVISAFSAAAAGLSFSK